MLKKVLLLLVIVLLAIPLTFATFTQEYGEWQDHYSNRGFIHDSFGLFNDVENGNFVTSISEGKNNVVTLAADVDNDGDVELIFPHSNFLRLYSYTGTLIDSLSGINITHQHTLTDDLNNNSYPEIHFIDETSDRLFIYEYNSTNFVHVFNFSLSSTPTTWTGIKCKDGVCYLIIDNGTNDLVYKYNLSTSSVTSLINFNVDDFSSIAIEDIDRDNKDELVISCDDDADGRNGVCVIDTNGDTISDAPFLDTGFDTDGIKDDLFDSATSSNSYITLWNFGSTCTLSFFPVFEYVCSGGADTEIIMTGASVGTDNTQVLSIDGSSFWSADSPATTEAPTASVIAFVDGDAWVCSGWGSTTVGQEVFCYDSTGTLKISYNNESASPWSAPNIWYGMPIVAADMDSDGNDEIITNRFILDLDTNTTIATFNLRQNLISVSDVTGDGLLDIIGTRAGAVSVFSTLSSNNPPTLNTSLDNSGYYGYYTSPVCLDTTVTFKAQQSGGTITGNYINDVGTDTERIQTNCGQLNSGAVNIDTETNKDNGTFHLSNPSFSCLYNVTGVFSVRLYLQDDANPTDLTQFDTITIQVINSTEGLTCNNGLISDVDDVPIVSTSPSLTSDDAINDYLNLITGGNATMLMIAAIIIILTLAGIGAQKMGVLGGLLGAFTGLILSTALGLIGVWVVIVITIFLVLIYLLKTFILSNNTQ